jgi:hypothetical protein
MALGELASAAPTSGGVGLPRTRVVIALIYCSSTFGHTRWPLPDTATSWLGLLAVSISYDTNATPHSRVSDANTVSTIAVRSNPPFPSLNTWLTYAHLRLSRPLTGDAPSRLRRQHRLALAASISPLPGKHTASTSACCCRMSSSAVSRRGCLRGCRPVTSCSTFCGRTFTVREGFALTQSCSLCFGVIIALPVATPKEYMNSASYAFGGWENTVGYPDGFAFILGMLTGMVYFLRTRIMLTHCTQCTGRLGKLLNAALQVYIRELLQSLQVI